MVQIDEIHDDPVEKTAMTYKDEGNVHFAASRFQDAIESYSQGLELCSLEETRLLAILFTNRAVCFTHLNDFESALEDCHAAVEADPEYAKGYLRRSTVYEKQNNFHEAVADMKKAFELDHSLERTYKHTLARLEKSSAEQFEKEKTEVIDKLKGVGNFVLGKFGLSLDNFKLQQTPEGSYTVQFSQNSGETPAETPAPQN